MKADLIKALRRNSLTIQTGQNITGEAADRIEELEAERDRLQTRLDHREGIMRDMQRTISKQEDEYDALVKGLRELANDLECTVTKPTEVECMLDQVSIRLRALLGDEV
jgi:chromosome segregation ATPase